MADGKVVFEIVGDSSKVDKTVKEVTKTIEQETKKWDKSADEAFDNAGTKANESANLIKEAFKGAATVVTASLVKITADIVSSFVEWATASIGVAADIEQIQGVIDTTFGQSGAEKIENWSKTAGTQFGYTELQAKKFASTLGVIFKASGLSSDEIADMSIGLTGLASDMAAYLNMDVDKAFDKIKKAMQGNKNALQDLGIQMDGTKFSDFYDSFGIESSFDAFSDAEQYAIRYKFIMQEMADIQNTYARESVDSYKGMDDQIKTLKDRAQEGLGESLLPFAKMWKEFQLGFYKAINGDYSVPITGTEEQLTKGIEELSATAEQARQQLDELAESYADLAGVTREDYSQSGFSGSFSDYVFDRLSYVRMSQLNGQEKQNYINTVQNMADLYSVIDEAEAKIANYQQQLDQLGYVPDTAGNAAASAQGIVDGLASKEGEIQSEVNAINSILSSLGTGGMGGFWSSFIPGFATGLDYVPKDNFPALLHQGEAVLTAQENMAWQSFKNGRPQSLDYDALGGVMRDNVRAGGNVYLDGRTVGHVISDMQGKTYRNLQRSGWQS